MDKLQHEPVGGEVLACESLVSLRRHIACVHPSLNVLSLIGNAIRCHYRVYHDLLQAQHDRLFAVSCRSTMIEYLICTLCIWCAVATAQYPAEWCSRLCECLTNAAFLHVTGVKQWHEASSKQQRCLPDAGRAWMPVDAAKRRLTGVSGHWQSSIQACLLASVIVMPSCMMMSMAPCLCCMDTGPAQQWIKHRFSCTAQHYHVLAALTLFQASAWSCGWFQAEILTTGNVDFTADSVTTHWSCSTNQYGDMCREREVFGCISGSADTMSTVLNCSIKCNC